MDIVDLTSYMLNVEIRAYVGRSVQPTETVADQKTN